VTVYGGVSCGRERYAYTVGIVFLAIGVLILLRL
jgi:hypothetical protein